MAVQTTLVNKPLNPRGNDQSPLAYNRAKLFSGKALDFDGVNDLIDISNFSLNGYTAFSICFYKTSDFNNAMIFSSADSINDGVNIYQISPGYFRARLNGVNAADTTLKVSEKEGFFVFTYDGTNAKWYYQAQNIDSGTTSQTFAIANTTSTIGRQSYAAAQYLSGEIAGFKLFNTALTAAQVADLYNNPEKVVPTGVDNTALKLWLPMQEGAGTTAYDGSGNGNHGTISGATYVHGIGAPVSQTAVIDWNKGTNLLTHSEEFTNAIYFQAGVGATAPVRTANQATAPDGQTTADKIVFPAVSGSGNLSVVYRAAVSLSGAHNSAIYLKGENGGEVVYFYYLVDGTYYTKECTLTTEWQRFDIDFTGGSTSYWHLGVDLRTGSGQVAQSASTIYAWGTNTNTGSLGPYVRTGATAQTSPVLLPQGLTTGRDITGVNLFENVRKQGALNLDGNSWAEVHDNASLDMTNLSLECWFDNTNAYDSIRYLFDKSAGSVNGFELRLVSQNSVQLVFRNLSTISKVATIPISGWVHVVGIYDGSDIIVYVDGTLAGSVASTGSIGTNDDALSIGGDNSFAPYRLNKPIAQPRIYNRALTAEEVQRNYNAGKNIYTNS